MVGRRHSFCNLIHFVSQKSKVEKQEDKVSKETYRSEFDKGGQDIKNFYEALVNEDTLPRKHANLPDLVSKQVKRTLKDQYKPVITNTKSIFKDVVEDKTTGFHQGDKTVCFKRSEPKLQASSSEFNRSSTHVSLHKLRLHSRLLQASQMGQLEQVSKLIENGANINHQDFYGWTPLMCAAKEGHKKVIKYLLQHGADHTICSLEGQTASILARMSGHENIVTTISNYSLDHLASHQSNATSDVAEQETHATGTFLCQICRSEFSVIERASHETSTVHLFNSGHKPKGPSYLIPETNKGFQILLKTGWEVDKGLGPTGEGLKYPIKTILKYDRKGLGSDVCVQKKAKITHYNPYDKSAVADNFQFPQRKLTARKAARYAVKARERKERQHDRYLRLELSSGFQ